MSFVIQKPPFVYIAGAGPGDPMLLTRKTHALLVDEEVDLVVYDRLIADEVLSLVPRNKDMIYAGKSCRQHHMTQDEINACLVEEAKKGKVVLRLKGGDPFIFGRGGEEAKYLSKHSVPYEIVPGVNAADGCAAYLGIPLTHRGVANSVQFITGHKQKDQPIDLDYKGLANPMVTKVIFMGGANLEDICHKLIEEGLNKNTPSVAIQQGTTPKERKCYAPVSDIAKTVQERDFKAPTLVIIGDVVALAR